MNKLLICDLCHVLLKAFSEDDMRRIKVSELRNDNNPKYGTHGTNNTGSWLSIVRQCIISGMTKKGSVSPLIMPKIMELGFNCGNGCFWWLRSPGDAQGSSSYVDTGGALYPDGDYVYNAYGVVRPALWVNL